MAKQKIQKQNVGNSGEYYIASRLSALDFTVTITLGRAEKFDILALSPKGKVIKISVKATQRDNATSFPLSKKDEVGASDDYYYAFVILNNFIKEPDVWIIPSKVVCPLIKSSHEIYLKNPGVRGQKVNDSPMRKLPIKLVDRHKLRYPGWEKEIDKYYKNFNQLL